MGHRTAQKGKRTPQACVYADFFVQDFVKIFYNFSGPECSEDGGGERGPAVGI